MDNKDLFIPTAMDLLITHFNFPYFENEIAEKFDTFQWNAFYFPTKDELSEEDIEFLLKSNTFGYSQHCYCLLFKEDDYFKKSTQLDKLKKSLDAFRKVEGAQELLDRLNRL